MDNVREVKRHAEVGEYIKLTRRDYTFGKVGDILLVSVTVGRNKGFVGVWRKHHPQRSGVGESETWMYLPDEYVVLEGYEPEEVEQRQKAERKECDVQKMNIPTRNHLESVQRNVQNGKATEKRAITWRRRLETTCTDIFQRQRAEELLDRILAGESVDLDA